MSDEDVSAEDTRYIQAGFAGRHTGELLFAGVREEREREREREIYGRVLSICDIRGLCIYRLKTGACPSQVNTIKYLISRRNAKDRIFED